MPRDVSATELFDELKAEQGRRYKAEEERDEALEALGAALRTSSNTSAKLGEALADLAKIREAWQLFQHLSRNFQPLQRALYQRKDAGEAHTATWHLRSLVDLTTNDALKDEEVAWAGSLDGIMRLVHTVGKIMEEREPI